MLAPEMRMSMGTPNCVRTSNCVRRTQLFLCTVDTVRGERKVTADFLWQQRARPTRGPKPALTLDQIAEAAIAIADAEGLAAVSMQRVAADLGYTKMSLYRYLPGKNELVAAMIERALQPPPAVTGPWREALTGWATA